MKRHATKHGAFHIDALHGQPQIAHCHGFFVPVTLRGNGFGHQLKTAQMQTLVEQRYDYAICTVDAGNIAQKSVLTNAGWQRIADFPNSKTGGQTEIWGWQVGGGGDK